MPVFFSVFLFTGVFARIYVARSCAVKTFPFSKRDTLVTWHNL